MIEFSFGKGSGWLHQPWLRKCLSALLLLLTSINSCYFPSHTTPAQPSPHFRVDKKGSVLTLGSSWGYPFHPYFGNVQNFLRLLVWSLFFLGLEERGGWEVNGHPRSTHLLLNLKESSQLKWNGTRSRLGTVISLRQSLCAAFVHALHKAFNKVSTNGTIGWESFIWKPKMWNAPKSKTSWGVT